MATLYKSGLVESNAAFTAPNGYLHVRQSTFIVPAAVAANDVIQMVPLKAGEKLYGVEITLPAGDDGTAIRYDVGYGNDGTTVATTSDDILNDVQKSTINKKSTFDNAADDTLFASGPFSVATDTTIDIHVATGPTTGNAGTAQSTYTVIAYIG